MDKVAPINNKKLIRGQACLWISRLDRGLNYRQQKDFVAWVNADSVNKQVIFELAALWDDERVQSELEAIISSAPSSKNKRTSNVIKFGLAASVLFCTLVLVGPATGLKSFISGFDDSDINYTTAFTTHTGQRGSFLLPDGSDIQLNTNSEVLVEYSAKSRSITLIKGEAQFDVAKDVNRPFTVNSGKQSFTALGTIFNIEKADSKNVELLVTEGKVLITNNNIDFSKISLGFGDNTQHSVLGSLVIAGQFASIENNTIQKREMISSERVEKELAWQKDMLIFDGEPLAEVLNEVERYAAVDFAVSPSIANLKISGYYKAGDVPALLQSLQLNFDINYQLDKNGKIQLSKATR